MEIREPEFKVGENVYCEESKCNAIIIGISDYSFVNDKYYYSIRYDDGDEDEMIEDMLDLYIEKPKTVWELKENNTCFWINNGIPLSLHWNDSPEKIRNREIGNVFLTEGEALADLERRKIETEMISLGGRRKFESNRDNYGIYYCDGINVTFISSCTMYQGLIYFDTRKEAEEAIKEIGKNRIKKYVFGVNK